MSHALEYLRQTVLVAQAIDYGAVDDLAVELQALRERCGRLFVLGLGGSAANASHAVNDFRKLCDIEAYAPTDSVSELTARANDEGWETIFAQWLASSKANPSDALLVLSVGGGDAVKSVSLPLIMALKEADMRGLKLFGIVGRDGGFTRYIGDLVVVVPTVDPEMVTPHTESFQSVILHCLVSHPRLQINKPKWESACAPKI